MTMGNVSLLHVVTAVLRWDLANLTRIAVSVSIVITSLVAAVHYVIVIIVMTLWWCSTIVRGEMMLPTSVVVV